MPIHFDIPFVDKNNERKMLAARIKQIIDHLAGRIFTDSENTGDFLFRDGQSDISKINEGEWTAFGKDDFWGYKEQYCWFKQTVTVPDRFAGKTVVYDITPFPSFRWENRAQQFIVFVNGKMVQGVDMNHTYIILEENAKGGESYDIALNAYCDDWEYRGPTQLCANLKVIDNDIAALYYDLLTPWETAHLYSHDDLQRVDIVKHLNNAVNLLELNTADYAVFKESVAQARAYIEENIYGIDNGVYTSAIGHTHIDTAWLWRLRQTRDKTGRSFATVINLMREYKDYKFMSPQAQLYDFVKQDYPELYEEIKQMIKEGRWEAEGSMWVESDTNVVSGESLVRQFLVGKRFFKDEFGVDNKIMWLPDVFGYSGALPQIMKKADIDYFMTTKISWNEYNKFPFDTFMWKGIDGTEILSHFIPSLRANEKERFQTTYNADLTPDQIIGGWQRYSNKDLNRNVLCSFGHGDGGGGPTRGMLEKGIRMAKGIQGCPNVKMEFARDYFDRLAEEVKGSDRLPKWAGELYLEFHRGTLTAQARNKKYNRKSELLYHDAETICKLAQVLTGADYPAAEILEAWKIILLNQFHDIIPGSSIAAVYEDSKEQYETILADGRGLIDKALTAITDGICVKEDSVVVFNTLGFDRTDVVLCDLPDGVCVYDTDGTALPTQKTYDGKTAFLAKNIPAKGYKTFALKAGTSCVCGALDFADNTVDNAFYTVVFDANMNIASMLHKKSGRLVAPEGQLLNRLIAYEDRPHNHEAWDIKCYYDEKYWYVDDVTSCEVIESGAVRTVIKVVRPFNLSTIEQYFIFYPHSDRFDIFYDIDWKEKNIALKADFPVDVNAVKATFDIQFGNLERTAHNNTTWDFAQFEVCGHKWADLSDNSFGLSVLNDCKYGWTVKDGHIKPTLLRCATTPNHLQDRERHTFTFAVYAHSGAVANSDVVNQGYSLNVPLYAKKANAHEGALADSFSLIAADADNICIETVKKAEDSDAVIVRLYETWNKETVTWLSFGKQVKEISECNLLEEKDEALKVCDNKLPLRFKPFEIKTLKITF
ncbi:MAG: alpha-mannosidase [Clostridia bacterium]|nr:alpha-mannosidase [Clostridia bacterium]